MRAFLFYGNGKIFKVTARAGGRAMINWVEQMHFLSSLEIRFWTKEEKPREGLLVALGNHRCFLANPHRFLGSTSNQVGQVSQLKTLTVAVILCTVTPKRRSLLTKYLFASENGSKRKMPPPPLRQVALASKPDSFVSSSSNRYYSGVFSLVCCSPR